MNISKFLYFVLGALVAGLVTWWLMSGKQVVADVPDTSRQSALDVIMTRTSIRSYQDRPVSADTVELLLRASMAAPSAMNRQPWAFVVVDDKELLRKLSESLPYAKMAAAAPLAVVVCGDLSKGDNLEGAWWMSDAAAASENLLLAAHTVGLGAVWTGVYPRSERVQAVREVLGLPEQIIPLNLIPIGYPADKPAPKQKWAPEKVHKNGWTN
ncbi:nitroreductase family protein [uncultured Alistipes sp.]|jgi:hypothetical protein|uniref:nitroreductase family protein n=1 Tax=uncultured Alistipes sp. TaxID=538949 RepID=UPI0025F47DF3|nr:nitroreductase family protein [uncultured Alistipes sp.]